MPITYFQTLVDYIADGAEAPTRNGGGSDDDDAESVDVDALIRKGQVAGFKVQ